MIRALTSLDAEETAALIRTAFGAITVSLDPAPSALKVTASDVSAHLELGGGAGWFDGGLRGCVLWRPKEDGLYLGRLAVAPDWSGRGVAQSLVAVVEAEGRRRGLRRIMLEVRLPLVGNRRLFAKCGFQETVQRAHPGFDAPTSVEAEKLLD